MISTIFFTIWIIKLEIINYLNLHYKLHMDVKLQNNLVIFVLKNINTINYLNNIM